MAEGVLFNIAEGIIERLQSLALQEIGLLCGAKDELHKLEKIVTKIKAVLLDAEEKQVNPAVKEWLQSLEDVVYDADDLLDEFYMEAQRRQVATGNKISKPVRIFFSSSNQLVFRLKIGHKIKEIRETLDMIANDRKFHLEERLEDTRVISKERESHSFVRKEDIIGREKDKKAIIQLLLDPMSEENVSTISIVGIGGLGKTALAQLVFNDDKVQKHFELKMWICVSTVFELNILVKKIIESAPSKPVENLEINQLQNYLRKEIDGKRYLLVLDDVWNENRQKWLSLKNLLVGGARGSRILITTRSEKVANIADTTKPYTLGGLDENQSWLLFKEMAFKHGKEPENSRVKAIGVEIVGKCRGVPLAIRTIGRMLYSKDGETEWLAFKNNDLSKISQEENDVLPTLKLSYDSLPSHLKHCFAYCSLFPKDYEIDVKTLINLWVAQGFIKCSYENESLENVGYQYFMELLWRSFFQEERYDDWLGMISSCKMHDLMHDLASLVSGQKSTIIDVKQTNQSENVSGKLCHVSFDFEVNLSSWQIPTSLLKANKMRTFVLTDQDRWNYSSGDKASIKVFCNAIASNFKSLRMLSLSGLGITTLPKCLRRMKHLRYLDLSTNPIKRLPKWTVRLQNLQILDLSNCRELLELPRDIKKLFNLRHIMISDCRGLTHMPYGLGELTCLRTLDRFVLSEDKYISRCSAGLGELNRLNELTGELTIKNLRHGKDAVSEAIAANMKEKQHLSSLTLKWNTGKATEDINVVENGEMSLEALQPHSNLKELCISYYEGVKFAGWLSALTNIVHIKLFYCQRCQHLPPLDHLPCLKHLELWGLSGLEYISDEMPASSSASPFFPSLKQLVLHNCPNLKGWWKQIGQVGPSMTEYEQHHLFGSLPSFPCLSQLEIWGCPNLTCMPLYPHLEESLVLEYTSLKPLEQTMMMKKKNEDMATTAATSSACNCCSLFSLFSPFFSTSSSSPLSKLISLRIANIEDMECVPEIWLRNLASLKRLTISCCPKLRCIPLSPSPSIQHLTTLEYLNIANCNELDLWKDENCMQWKALRSLHTLCIWGCDRLMRLPEGMGNLTSLQQLQIESCSNLASLPEGMGNLTSLQQLGIVSCSNLASLPEWMCRLTSLQNLQIYKCSILSQRCKKEIGEDWSKIAHIPNVAIYPQQE